MTAYVDRSTWRPNIKDRQPQRRRADNEQAWTEAGFERCDWNKWKLVVVSSTGHYRTCRIVPGRDANGQMVLKAKGRTINGELTFPANHPPAKIAAYLGNLADNPVEASEGGVLYPG